MLRTYAGLQRSIYFLFIAQVVNSVGHFVRPFLTLFLTRRLGMGALEASFYVTLSALAWVPSSLAAAALLGLLYWRERAAARTQAGLRPPSGR